MSKIMSCPILLLELRKRTLPCSDVLEHHVLALGSQLCASLPSSIFSDFADADQQGGVFTP